MSAPDPANYTVKHAALRLGVGRTTVYKFIADGLLRKIKVGSKTLIPVVDVDRVIEALHAGSVVIDKRDLRDGEAARNAAHKERMRAQRAEAKVAKAPAATRQHS